MMLMQKSVVPDALLKQQDPDDGYETYVTQKLPDTRDLQIVETSPQNRFVRFNELLGKGAHKEVYRSWDTSMGIEVAWNVIHVNVLKCNKMGKRVIQEMKMLQELKHPNILKFFASWLNSETQTLNFVTEFVSSGSLRDFISTRPVRLNILKRWCSKILGALSYLHNQEIVIIHRDLKCENIFIDGPTGDLRIGDLGLASWRRAGQHAQSVLGTPEYMAPELYDEKYDEQVDIYSFGMLVLELVTKKTPYSECSNAAQIFKKVSQGVLPESFERLVTSPVKEFIRSCIQKPHRGNRRPSATELLADSFLQPSTDGTIDEKIDCLDFYDISTPLPRLVVQIPCRRMTSPPPLLDTELLSPVSESSDTAATPVRWHVVASPISSSGAPGSPNGMVAENQVQLEVRLSFKGQRIGVAFEYDVNEPIEETVREMVNERCFPADLPCDATESLIQKIKHVRKSL